MESDRRDRGFSLVELLVVIVILGILATVTVFAVRGISDRGETSACVNDEKTVIHAMEARFADRGSYASEATLQTEGFLRSESQLHDVTLTADDYDVVAVGSCVGAGATSTVAGPSSSTSTTTTTTLPSGVTALTVGGFPAQQRGDGSGNIGLFFGAGTAAADAAAVSWAAFQGFPYPTNETVIWVDLRSAGDDLSPAQLVSVVAILEPDFIAMQHSAGNLPIELLASTSLHDAFFLIPRCFVPAGAGLTDCQMTP